MPGADPIEVFLSYAHKDERLKNKLRTHLHLLQRQGIIADWHDRDITAGDEWKGQIDTHLKRARIILLLISPDFLASDYCYDVELKRAMSRHRSGRAVVIPVFLRPCDWKGAPFGKIQGLPTDAEPVTSRRWSTQDEAFAVVSRGIRAAVEKHRKDWQSTTRSAASTFSQKVPAEQPANAATKPKALPVKQAPASTDDAVKAKLPSKPQTSRVAGPAAKVQPLQRGRAQQISNTGAWVLLGDHLFLSKGVMSQPDGSVEVQITPKTAEEEADLLALASGRSGYGSSTQFSHQNQAFWTRIELLGSVSGASRPVYKLKLTPEKDTGSSWMEIGYSNLSADQAAEARSRLLLLNEKYASADRWHDNTLSAISLGRPGGQTLTESPFPALWQEAHRQVPVFLRRARLWAVFYLKASGLCEHILELDLGPVQDGMLAVQFRGRRRKVFDNQKAATIEAAGTCLLNI